ncbi:hypothetical protein AGLY_000448 [Aphis glycines]|uniref:Uncharacterized protein n=1 Tax=Aphis glycines TaxID=307491 RepID=A0A6G0U700_APHGL|nr:hypothetical protein AGLY_000448 [Aphis glycines]
MKSRKGKKILPKQKQTSVTRVMWSPAALDNSGIISKKINEPYLDLIHTLSSPFKVLTVKPSDVQPSLINSSADINPKINRTTCILKNDLQYLNDKVSSLENILLKQDEQLDAFEKNLLNNDFRTKMFSRNSLPSTTRSIMRYIFKDSILENIATKVLKKRNSAMTVATAEYSVQTCAYETNFGRSILTLNRLFL